MLYGLAIMQASARSSELVLDTFALLHLPDRVAGTSPLVRSETTQRQQSSQEPPKPGLAGPGH